MQQQRSRRAYFIATLLGSLIALAAGCDRARPEPLMTSWSDLPSARTDVLPSVLSERLLAAERVGSIPLRDRALAAVALDAARLAARHGTLADARAIAAKIRTLPLRDSVFAEIASGG